MFEGCVVRCGCKKAHQEDTWSEEIGQCAENVITVQGLKGGGG